MTDPKIRLFCINAMSPLGLYLAGVIDRKEYLRRRLEETNGD
jgi:hypothetical protein